MKRLVIYVLVAVVAVPVAIILTFVLLPLWRFIEARWGIESVGHSGPADWCFWTVYGVVLVMMVGIFNRRTPGK